MTTLLSYSEAGPHQIILAIGKEPGQPDPISSIFTDDISLSGAIATLSTQVQNLEFGINALRRPWNGALAGLHTYWGCIFFTTVHVYERNQVLSPVAPNEQPTLNAAP